LTLYIERRDRYIKIIIRAGLRARGGEEDIGVKKETFILIEEELCNKSGISVTDNDYNLSK